MLIVENSLLDVIGKHTIGHRGIVPMKFIDCTVNVNIRSQMSNNYYKFFSQG